MKPLPETTFILDGRATLFRRPRSSMWQVRFKTHNRWVHFTTGTESLEQAKEIAFELALDAWFKERNNLPVITKNFKYVANLAIQELDRGYPWYSKYDSLHSNPEGILQQKRDSNPQKEYQQSRIGSTQENDRWRETLK